MMNWLVTAFCLAGLAGCASGSDYHVDRDLVYKTAGQTELKGDLYLPEGNGPKPAVLVVHGGGWDKKAGDMEHICKRLAQAGFVAFNVTYRLAPDVHYPAPVDDIRDALTWMKQNSAKYNIDTNRLGGWGYSAGAHLILQIGIDGSQGMKGLVAGGAPVDFSEWPASPIITKFIGHTSDERPDLWKEAAPINHINDQSPPVFLYHGEWDDLVDADQPDRLKKVMDQHNRKIEIHRVAYMGHVMVYLFSEESVRRGVAFLQEQLK